MMGAVSRPQRTVVSSRGVTKRFGRIEALCGVDIDIAAGEVVAVLGPSGCGKSTLLAALAGLHEIDAGTIEIGGVTVAGPTSWVAPQDRRVGVVFQDHALFPHLTVEKNVMFGVSALDRSARRARAAEMLDLVRLSGFGERYPHELSGGESQRVALARALAPAPVVLLLDEPFASLDPELRDDLRFEIAGLLRAANVASLLVTHDHLDAMMVADRIAIMRSGTVVQEGTAQEVFDRPIDEGVGRTFGSLLAFAVDGSGCTELGPVPPSRIVTWPSGPVVVARPHDLIAKPLTGCSEPAVRTSGAGVGVVTSRTFLGAGWRLVVALASGTEVQIDCQRASAPAAGDAVHVRFAPQ
jgi:iron(III) transport system ATP-binding protein